MASRTSDFERFLYANYPDDYRRVTAPDVADDVIEAILARHRSHYSIWKDIPEWIKSEYGDRLPAEVLNGNVTPRQFVNKEIEENSVKGGEIGAIIDMMIIDISVAVLAKGYSQESAVTLAKNRVKRDKILASAEGGELTNEQREVWRKTRESDKATITNDWKYNQPEKYLMHIIKEMSREYKRATREGREPSSEKIEGLTNELEYYMTGLETTEDKRKLAEYLRQESQQAALKHLEPSVLEMVTGMLKAQGIVITQSENTNSRMDVAKEESLSESLEKDFNQMQKMKDILINKYKYQNSKTSLLDVLNGNDSIGQLMSIKRDGTSR